MFDPNETSLLVRSYYDVQQVRVLHQVRVKSLVRAKEFPTEHKTEKHFGLGVEELLAAEKVMQKRVDQSTADHPVRVQFMSRVRGIGPILSSGVIAQIARREQVLALIKDGSTRWITAPDQFPNEGVRKERYTELGVAEILSENGAVRRRRGIECFDSVGKLWAFAGLAVNRETGLAVRRTKGEKCNWSPNFKTLCWKIGQSFEKLGRSYRAEYLNYKARIKLAHPEEIPIPGTNRKRYTDGNIRAMSCRYAAKLFIAHTWYCWRELDGLPTRPPYPVEYLGHTTVKSWRDYLDRPSKGGPRVELNEPEELSEITPEEAQGRPNEDEAAA